jgi:hypothetical protein
LIRAKYSCARGDSNPRCYPLAPQSRCPNSFRRLQTVSLPVRQFLDGDGWGTMRGKHLRRPRK